MKKVTSIRIETDLWQDFKILCAQRHVSVSEQTAKLLERWICTVRKKREAKAK